MMMHFSMNEMRTPPVYGAGEVISINSDKNNLGFKLWISMMQLFSCQHIDFVLIIILCFQNCCRFLCELSTHPVDSKSLTYINPRYHIIISKLHLLFYLFCIDIDSFPTVSQVEVSLLVDQARTRTSPSTNVESTSL